MPGGVGASDKILADLFLYQEKAMADILATLDNVLSEQPYLEGQELTVADVAVGAYLLYIPAFFPQVGQMCEHNGIAYTLTCC